MTKEIPQTFYAKSYEQYIAMQGIKDFTEKNQTGTIDRLGQLELRVAELEKILKTKGSK